MLATMNLWCRVCGKHGLSVSDFYLRQLGVTGRGECKECTKSRVTLHRNSNLSAVRAYDRDRAKLAHRKELAAQRGAAFVRRYPRAALAHNLVYSALKSGHVQKSPCECGDSRVIAHHDDYLKPLDVRWMCQSCHLRWHIKNGPGLNKEGPVEKKPRGHWKRMLEKSGADNGMG